MTTPWSGVSRPEAETLSRLPERVRPLAKRLRPLLVPELTHKSRRTAGLIGGFATSIRGPVANIGSGTRRYGEHVLNLDIAPMPGVDVVGVAEQLPLRDEMFDGAILQAVLEHVEDAGMTIRELLRILKPGGEVFVEIPFIQGFHGSPGDFRRFTEHGLAQALGTEGFEVVETGIAVGPGSGMAWVLSEYLALLFSVGSRSFRAARILTRWISWPLKWSDAWLDRHPMAFTVASGVWARARKPAS